VAAHNKRKQLGRRIAVVVFVLLMAINDRAIFGQVRGSKRVERSGKRFLTTESQKRIDSGLAWLAARQFKDGSFGTGGAYGRNVAVSALCGIAFLSSGSTPGRGQYGRHVQKTVDFILASATPSGFINDKASESHGPMYGHGFATLFLAEVYGMTARKDVREKLEKAAKLIIKTQNKDGGWRYHPEASEADISVTVCQIMALRAARNCGIFVPKQTVDRCIDYVKRCQNPRDGGFRYRLKARRDSLFPRSAAGIVALYSAGVYEGREIDRGLKYLMRYIPQGAFFQSGDHYFYGQYYAVQAMWQAGGTFWDRWFPAIRDELLRSQKKDGSWDYRTICDEYGTAMALIVLQVPNNYLPIFEH
jgi:prenyltransferase beta subunit